MPAYVERDLRKFLECGVLAHGFARARCEKCGRDFLVAYSCKGRGVCPGCNTRRMVETAAHMVEHVFPAVAVRQWVVVIPKRLRYFMNHDAGCLSQVARIAMSEVQRATAGASTSTAVAARSGGVLFVHRFGATLNAHVHLHLCMLDGVVAQGRQGLVFRGARVDEACVERVQAGVRQRVLGLFERRGLLSSETVAVMQGWGHKGGFSVHAGERIVAQGSARCCPGHD